MATLLDRITLNPEICHGKPTIRSMRYPVETILELLSSGMTTEEILADYEDLEREDIPAVLYFAARLNQVSAWTPLPREIPGRRASCSESSRSRRRESWIS